MVRRWLWLAISSENVGLSLVSDAYMCAGVGPRSMYAIGLSRESPAKEVQSCPNSSREVGKCPVVLVGALRVVAGRGIFASGWTMGHIRLGTPVAIGGFAGTFLFDASMSVSSHAHSWLNLTPSEIIKFRQPDSAAIGVPVVPGNPSSVWADRRMRVIRVNSRPRFG